MKNNPNELLKISVPGFVVGGFSAGLKADEAQKDLGVIFCQSQNAVSAAVFTKNIVCAAPVLISKSNLKNKTTRLIVVNSGNANAATGAEGLKRASAVVDCAAKKFSVSKKEVMVCSTGKIGVPLPHKKITTCLENNHKNISAKNFLNFENAILTTDAYAKFVFKTFKLKNKIVRLVVLAKGAGMISPDMATMLCFVLTDANFEKSTLQNILKNSVDETLNAMTVDGDTSTNDSVILLSSRLSHAKAFAQNSAEAKIFEKYLREALQNIAIQIVGDGEGATKVIEYIVSGCKNKTDAMLVARTIANSPLVKTAMFGNDPNWGRIAAAAGRSGIKFNADKLKIKIGKSVLFDAGRVLEKNLLAAHEYLKSNSKVIVTVDLGAGKASGRIYGSDLNYDYVKCNAEYST